MSKQRIAYLQGGPCDLIKAALAQGAIPERLYMAYMDQPNIQTANPDDAVLLSETKRLEYGVVGGYTVNGIEILTYSFRRMIVDQPKVVSPC